MHMLKSHGPSGRRANALKKSGGVRVRVGGVWAIEKLAKSLLTWAFCGKGRGQNQLYSLEREVS